MTEQRLELSTHKAWDIAGLAATGPLPGLEEKLALFGQFVGDWDIVEDRYLRPDGTWTVGRGELHWNWILQGRALQDIWGFVDESSGKLVPEGTTLRFYDARIDAWHSVWFSPAQGVVKTFVAQKVGDEIVLEGNSTEGFPVKWIFSEITSDSFRWRSEETRDDGKTWLLKEEMRIRRRPHVGKSVGARSVGLGHPVCQLGAEAGGRVAFPALRFKKNRMATTKALADAASPAKIAIGN